MASLSNDYIDKTYIISDSPNSFQSKSSVRLDLTDRRVKSNLGTNSVEERLEKIKSAKSSEKNMDGRIDFENYFENNKKNTFQLPPVVPKLEPKPIKMEPLTTNQKVNQVKQRSAVQMVNDLTHLSKNLSHCQNVNFSYGDNLNIRIHSLILLVRSQWFRRSWRMAGDMNKNTLERKLYNFHYKSTFGCGENIDISLTGDLPEIQNGEFEFEIILDQNQDINKFHEAFKQFKQFLYKGDCEINDENSLFLTVLAEAFMIDTLKDFLSVYYQSSINSDDIDSLLKTIQLAHIFDIKDLKVACITMINKNARLIVNAASWKKLSNKYPELVLEIFKKN